MKHLTALVLAAALVLPGCGGNFGAQGDSPSAAGTSSSSGATRAPESHDTPENASPWANDHNFIAPAT